MKRKNILVPLLASIILSTITPSLQAISLAEQARQFIANKLNQAQEKLAIMQNNITEYGNCVLQGTCTSEQQKNLSNTLKLSAAALGTLILTILAAAAATTVSKDKKESVSPAIKTKFLFAVTNSDRETAQQMIDAGVSPDERDIRGWNALSIAASENDIAMVQFLLQKGATPTLHEEVETKVNPEIKKIIGQYLAGSKAG